MYFPMLMIVNQFFQKDHKSFVCFTYQYLLLLFYSMCFDHICSPTPPRSSLLPFPNNMYLLFLKNAN